jgi:hypothetical protein
MSSRNNDQAMQRDQPLRKPSNITADMPTPARVGVRMDVRARKVWLWWTLPALGLTALAALVGVIAWRWASSVTADDDLSILVIEHSGEDKFMEGIVYDKAILNINATQIVVIPGTAMLERGAAEGRVEVYMRKHITQGGFPRPTSDRNIRNARTYMGCVWRVEEGKLVIASYGESSGMEQGTNEHLLIRVPELQTLETRPDLSGVKPVKGFDRVHQSPREPGEDGWETIPVQPDPARTAARVK